MAVARTSPATKAGFKAASKASAKPATKRARNPVAPARAAASPANGQDAAVAARPATVRDGAVAAAPEGRSKPKLVRDSFTIPKAEYAVLAELKQRSVRLGHPAKKSELLRAGIAALQGLSDEALLASVRAVPSLKPGRPKDSGKRQA